RPDRGGAAGARGDRPARLGRAARHDLGDIRGGCGGRRAQRAVLAPLAGVAGDDRHRPRLGPGAGAVRPAGAAVGRPRRVHRRAVIWGPWMSLSMGVFQDATPPGALPQVLAARSSLLILAAPIGIALGGPLVAALGSRGTL